MSVHLKLSRMIYLKYDFSFATGAFRQNGTKSRMIQVKIFLKLIHFLNIICFCIKTNNEPYINNIKIGINIFQKKNALNKKLKVNKFLFFEIEKMQKTRNILLL